MLCLSPALLSPELVPGAGSGGADLAMHRDLICLTGSDPRALPTYSNRSLVLCSVCASSASVFGMVPNTGKAFMSDFSDLCLFIYLFILTIVNLTIN